MPDMQFVKCEIEKNGVANVILNRPKVHNAFNEVMIAELTSTFERLAEDKHVRLAVMRGEGPSFCAGADLEWMRKMKNYSMDENVEDSRKMAVMYHNLNEFPKPLIGQVHGAAIGGGLGLVAACDYVVAALDTRFALSEVRLGLVPAVVSPFVIAKIGETEARARFLSGEPFNAEAARRMGLIHEEVVDYAILTMKMQSVINSFLKAGPEAAMEAKRLIANLMGHKREAVMDYTCRLIARMRVTDEAQEGMDALLNKRQPNWIKPRK